MPGILRKVRRRVQKINYGIVERGKRTV